MTSFRDDGENILELLGVSVHRTPKKGSEEEAADTPVRYWVDTPQHHYLFDGDNAEQKAKILARLFHRTQQYRIWNTESDSVVPTEVVSLGKAAVTGYLYVVQEWPIHDIADELDLTRESTRQYLRDLAGGRR